MKVKIYEHKRHQSQQNSEGEEAGKPKRTLNMCLEIAKEVDSVL